MSVVSHRNFATVPPAATPTIDFFGICQLLGIHQRGQQARIDYLETLQEHSGFPPPLPHHVVRRIVDHAGRSQRVRELRRHISPAKSRWLRAPVDAWLNGTVPPHLQAAIDDQDARDAAARLDDAAERIAGGNGREQHAEGVAA